jgi:hypothetical protein
LECPAFAKLTGYRLRGIQTSLPPRNTTTLGSYCTFLSLTANTDFITRDKCPSPLQIRQGMPSAPQQQAFGPIQGL